MKAVELAVDKIGGNCAEWRNIGRIDRTPNLFDTAVETLLSPARSDIKSMTGDEAHKNALTALAKAEYDEGVERSVFENTGGFTKQQMLELSEETKVFYYDIPSNTVRFYGKALHTAARNEFSSQKK
jgi:hypothetical protein